MIFEDFQRVLHSKSINENCSNDTGHNKFFWSVEVFDKLEEVHLSEVSKAGWHISCSNGAIALHYVSQS